MSYFQSFGKQSFICRRASRKSHGDTFDLRILADRLSLSVGLLRLTVYESEDIVEDKEGPILRNEMERLRESERVCLTIDLECTGDENNDAWGCRVRGLSIEGVHLMSHLGER